MAAHDDQDQGIQGSAQQVDTTMSDNAEELSPVMAQLLALLEEDDSKLFDAPVKPRKLTSEDRVERGFVEILEFYDAHHREPDSDAREISERKLGARLVGIRSDEKKLEALADLDDVGLLKAVKAPSSLDELLADETIFADLLDDDGDDAGIFDVSALPRPKKNPAEPVSVEVRSKADNFEQYRPLFQRKQAELAGGDVKMIAYRGVSTIQPGAWFVLGGQLAFIAEVFPADDNAPIGRNKRPKHRILVLFDNGTQSKMYAESFDSRMYEKEGFQLVADETEFRIEDFGDLPNLSGIIYVLRSLSEDPDVSSIANLRKIGFTTTPIEQRVAGAEKSATYLFAPVEIEATYKLYGLRPSAVEHLLHKVFSSVRVEIAARGSDGQTVEVTEWFIAPLEAINEAVQLIGSSEIQHYHYDKVVGQLVKNS